MDKSRHDIIFTDSLKKNNGGNTCPFDKEAECGHNLLSLRTWPVNAWRTSAWLTPGSTVTALLCRRENPVTAELPCRLSPWDLGAIKSVQILPPESCLLTLHITMSWNCFNVQLSVWLFLSGAWRSNVSEIDKIIIACSTHLPGLCDEPSSSHSDVYLRPNVRNREFSDCEWGDTYLDLHLSFFI